MSQLVEACRRRLALPLICACCAFAGPIYIDSMFDLTHNLSMCAARAGSAE